MTHCFGGEPVALIVGADSYDSPRRSQDAKYLVEILLQAGFEENRTLLMTSDSDEPDMVPTLLNLEKQFGQLGDLITSEDDLVLVVLAGPCCSVSRKLFFCPKDSDWSLRSMMLVADLLEKIPAKRLVLVMDSTFPSEISDKMLPLSVTNVDRSSIPEHAVLFMNDAVLPDEDILPAKSLCRYFADILKADKADLNGDGKTEVRELLRYCEIQPERLVFKGFRPGKEWDDEVFARKFAVAPVPRVPQPKTPEVVIDESENVVVEKFPVEINAHPGHTVVSLVFFQQGNKTFLISGADGGMVSIYQLQQAKPLLEQRFGAKITSVAINPSGSQFLVATRNMLVELWALEAGDDGESWSSKKIHTFPQFKELHPRQQGIIRVAFDPAGTNFLAASSQAVCIWTDAPDDDYPVQVLHPRTDSLFFEAAAAVFLPGGDQVLTAFAESPISLWNVPNHALDMTVLREFPQYGIINDIAFSPVNDRIVSVGRNNRAVVWDVSSGRGLLQFDAHTDDITAVAFAPDGNSVLTGSHDGTALLWDTRNGELLRPAFTGFHASVMSVAFSPGGEYLALGLSNGNIMIYSSKDR